jgi:hypothetical protein
MNLSIPFTAHGMECRATFSYFTRPASWTLLAGGRALHCFPATSEDTHESVVSQCRSWLATNCFQALILDEHFVFFRVHRESLHPLKQDPGDFTSWLVVSDGAYVTHIPIEADPCQDAAVAALTRWLRAHLIGCFGGPWDGRRVAFQGESFAPIGHTATFVPDALGLGYELNLGGRYIRSERGYEWRG